MTAIEEYLATVERYYTDFTWCYFFEWKDRAEIIVGSSNVTEGGFFRNYEGCARVTYDLPGDAGAYISAQSELAHFLALAGPVTYPLTEPFLKQLIARNAIPTEAEARRNRDIGLTVSVRSGIGSQANLKPLFGTEHIELPPPLPASLLESLVENVRRRRRQIQQTTKKKKRTKIAARQPPIGISGDDALLAAAFYMTLPTLQGENIPGEARIPLEAVELTAEFWGMARSIRERCQPTCRAEPSVLELATEMAHLEH